MGTHDDRMTVPTCLMFDALCHAPSGELYGKEIMNLTGLTSGTLYPVLRRQVERGRLAMRLEKPEESEGGRPLRKYYRLTPEGERVAAEIRIVPEGRPRKRKPKVTHLSAEALAEFIAEHPASTVMAAFRLLGMRLAFDLVELPEDEPQQQLSGRWAISDPDPVL